MPFMNVPNHTQQNSEYVSITGFEIISGFCDPLINRVDHNKNWSLVLLSRKICLELRHQVLRILFYDQHNMKTGKPLRNNKKVRSPILNLVDLNRKLQPCHYI